MFPMDFGDAVRRPRGWAALLPHFLWAFLLVTCGTASYWMIRLVLDDGNPLAPTVLMYISAYALVGAFIIGVGSISTAYQRSKFRDIQRQRPRGKIVYAVTSPEMGAAARDMGVRNEATIGRLSKGYQICLVILPNRIEVWGVANVVHRLWSIPRNSDLEIWSAIYTVRGRKFDYVGIADLNNNRIVIARPIALPEWRDMLSGHGRDSALVDLVHLLGREFRTLERFDRNDPENGSIDPAVQAMALTTDPPPWLHISVAVAVMVLLPAALGETWLAGIGVSLLVGVSVAGLALGLTWGVVTAGLRTWLRRQEIEAGVVRISALRPTAAVVSGAAGNGMVTIRAAGGSSHREQISRFGEYSGHIVLTIDDESVEVWSLDSQQPMWSVRRVDGGVEMVAAQFCREPRQDPVLLDQLWIRDGEHAASIVPDRTSEKADSRWVAALAILSVDEDAPRTDLDGSEHEKS